MSSYKSLDARLEDLTYTLKQKDTELDEYVNDLVASSVDDIDEDIKSKNKEIKDDIKQKVEEVKRKIRERKDHIKQKVEEVKRKPKDMASKDAEHALDEMEQDLSDGDLVSAHVDRWVASILIKASK